MLKRLIFTMIVAFASSASAQTLPVDVLRTQYPALYKLYRDHSHYVLPLANYATGQGFRQPYENLATILHEMIHIASAAHDGFFIDGIYYEPYLHRDAWPRLRNAEIAKYLTPQERTIITAIYLPNTPKKQFRQCAGRDQRLFPRRQIRLRQRAVIRRKASAQFAWPFATARGVFAGGENDIACGVLAIGG